MRHVFTEAERKHAAEMKAYYKLFGKPEKPKGPGRHQFTAQERHIGGVRGFNRVMELYPGNKFLEKKIRGWSTPENRARCYLMHCTVAS